MKAIGAVFKQFIIVERVTEINNLFWYVKRLRCE